MNKPGLSCWKIRDKCHSLHHCHSQQSAKPQKQTNLADQQLTENSETAVENLAELELNCWAVIQLNR